ncbi:MAG: rhomboid family intramembrane serine protease [Lachnospiraceae bacterium]|nr:rhomboid family intramembrane serine protease [Lachnospiraceae bacterium]
MTEEIREFLEKMGFTVLPNGPEGCPIYTKKDQGQGFGIIVVDCEETGDLLTKDLHRAMIAWTNERLKSDGCAVTSVITFFITSELAKYALFGDGTQFWIITPAGRIIVRTGQPEDFAGIRSELNKKIAPPAPVQSSNPVEMTSPVVHIKSTNLNMPIGFFEESAYSLMTCYFTLSLMILNILLFICPAAMDGMAGIESQWQTFASSWNTTIKGGKIWQMFTCMFIHGSFLHLSSNMLALLIIGYWLERRISRRAFLAVYFGGGLVGSLVSLLYRGVVMADSPRIVQVGWLRYAIDQRTIMAGGASGAIMALAGATFFRMFIGRSFDGYWPAERRPYLDVLVFISVLENIFVAVFVKDQGNTDVSAHLGGIFGGFLIMSLVMVILYRREQKQKYG